MPPIKENEAPKSRFIGGKQPLKNCIKTAIETIIEASNNAPPIAYVNNAAACVGFLWNHQQFVDEVREVINNPFLLDELQAVALEEMEKRSTNKRLKIIFKHVWICIVFDFKTMLLMKRELEELESDMPKIQA